LVSRNSCASFSRSTCLVFNAPSNRSTGLSSRLKNDITESPRIDGGESTSPDSSKP
jgi:hypothetical protein